MGQEEKTGYFRTEDVAQLSDIVTTYLTTYGAPVDSKFEDEYSLEYYIYLGNAFIYKTTHIMNFITVYGLLFRLSNITVTPFSVSSITVYSKYAFQSLELATQLDMNSFAPWQRFHESELEFRTIDMILRSQEIAPLLFYNKENYKNLEAQFK